MIMKTRAKIYQLGGGASLDTTLTDDRDTRPHINNADISPISHFTTVFDKDVFGVFDDTDFTTEIFGDLTSPNLLTKWNPLEWHQLQEPLDENVSELSPPTTPEDNGSSLVVEPFQSLFTEALPTNSSQNTHLFEEIVARKRAKREQTRKCRKVYGIHNKKLWCTQCRWKKACSRFNT